MSQEEINILKRALERERASRKAAEKILEEKSTELYETSEQLKQSNFKLEQLVKERTSELKGVFENIIDAYVVMDLWGKVLKMNDSAVNLLGYDQANEEFNLIDLALTSEVDKVMGAFDLLMQDGSITNFQVHIKTKSADIKLVQINASIILDFNNKPIAAQGIVRDITKEKKAEQQLIQSENRLSILIQNLDYGVLLENHNREIIVTNDKFCELFDIESSPSALVGIDCSQSLKQNKLLFENSEEFETRVYEIIKAKKKVAGDVLHMKNGKILERNYVPLFVSSDNEGHLWSYKDITLKRKYEQNLEAERKKYRSIIQNMDLGLVETQTDDRILMVNKSFAQMTGCKEQELEGKRIDEAFAVLSNRSSFKLEQNPQCMLSNDSKELKVKTLNGDIRYWLFSGAPNVDINGDTIGGIGIYLDITDLKSLKFQKEDLLVKLERSNDELQEYAHIVSHDLKSPLRSIDALIQWIKEDNKDLLKKETLQHFNHIETTLEKMEQLISDVLLYSSVDSDVDKEKNVDMNLLVSKVTDLLHVPKHITIKILNRLPRIMGDQTKLQQVFQNLISNAIKFIDKPKGIIEIDVKEQAKHYQFSIRDNGIGIDSQYQDQIFKIFNSLHKSKDSSGIGLSIVKKIVNLYGGNIWIESRVGSGSTFYFTLKKNYANNIN